MLCRFDFERVDIKGVFDEFSATEARIKELKEQGGIQRQVTRDTQGQLGVSEEMCGEGSHAATGVPEWGIRMFRVLLMMLLCINTCLHPPKGEP